jgi:hypothetical protein
MDDTINSGSVQQELRELKQLLLTSHQESMAYRKELQRVNKECMVMKHKVDILLTALEEVSKHSDNSTISSLASVVASIRTMGSDEQTGIPPKPSVVFTASKPHPDQIERKETKKWTQDDTQTMTSQSHTEPSTEGRSAEHHNDEISSDGWTSPSRRHSMVLIRSPPREAMELDNYNPYAVLKTLGKKQKSSPHQFVAK